MCSTAVVAETPLDSIFRCGPTELLKEFCSCYGKHGHEVLSVSVGLPIKHDDWCSSPHNPRSAARAWMFLHERVC